MKYKIIEQDERYFAGLEHPTEIVFGEIPTIGGTWKKVFHEAYDVIKMKTDPHQMIGLNCNAIDYEETHKVQYFALAETIDLIKQDEMLVTKKLPKGKYICFELDFDDMGNERRKAYDYCKKEGIKIHEGFDYENYLNHIRYDVPGAMVEICLKLEDD
jgi:predicted transcriptional regulator YdeE